MLTQISFPAGIELPPMANLHPNKTKKQNNCALYGQAIYKTATASFLEAFIPKIFENPHRSKSNRDYLLLVYLLACEPQHN